MELDHPPSYIWTEFCSVILTHKVGVEERVRRGQTSVESHMKAGRKSLLIHMNFELFSFMTCT